MSSNAVESALDIMDQFEAPVISHDADAKADRLYFVCHFWPAPFDVTLQYIGYDLLYPGIISPIYPRNYRTRTPGDGSASIDIEVPEGGFSSRFRPGYAVSCLNDTYKRKGFVSFDLLTDKNWSYADVKALQAEILPEPHAFPEFDRYRHREVHLIEERARRTDPVELEVLQLLIESNRKAKSELTIVMKETITNASKAMQSGLGRITATELELTFMQQAGMRVPKFMAEHSHRDDLLITNEVPAVAPAQNDSEVVQTSLALMQEMAQSFTSMAAQLLNQNQAAPADDRVAKLEAEIAELKGMMATPQTDNGKKK